jgi:hypothetical protein
MTYIGKCWHCGRPCAQAPAVIIIKGEPHRVEVCDDCEDQLKHERKTAERVLGR